MSTYGIPTSHQYCQGPAATRLVKSYSLSHTPAISGWKMLPVWSPAVVQEKETWPFSTIPACITHKTNREIEMRHSVFFILMWRNVNLSNSPWFFWSEDSQSCWIPGVRCSKPTANIIPVGSIITNIKPSWWELSEEVAALKWSKRSTLMKTFLHRLKENYQRW